MSQIGREFFREWVASNLDAEARPETNVSNLLMEAEEQGISEQEIAEGVGGNVLKAMTKAIASAIRA